jgi:2-polyprenyl-6-methoxyphenol hydroxylase-like FAD-dependent oxidoreductase
MPDVLVVGGGPTGLMLAAELKLAGADPLVLEAATDRREIRSLGLRGLNGRTVQTLALRGLLDQVAAAQDALFAEHERAAPDDNIGVLAQLLREGRSLGHFSSLPLITEGGSGVSNFLLKQHLLEQILAGHAAELGVRIITGFEVADVRIDGDNSAVSAVATDGRVETADWLVGCDGGRSVVRRCAGFAFPGTPPTMTGRVAVATLTDPGAVVSARAPGGLINLSMVPGEIATLEFAGGPDDRDSPVTADELAASIGRVTGVEVGVATIGTAIRFGDNTRQASTYRSGRVLLAGDAAHVHSPIGGQGLNLGLQDAANLGWKLALVARGLAAESLIDTYTAERHPVGERVLRSTRAQTALMRPGPQVDALREIMGETLQIPVVKERFIALANNFDIDYAPDEATATGRFATDADPALLHHGGGLLIDPAASPAVRHAATGYTNRLKITDATGNTHGDRATVTDAAGNDRGTIDRAGKNHGGQEAILVRPDGYIAWTSADPAAPGLREALSTWFGTPTP